MEHWCLQYGDKTEVHPISDEYGEYVIADIDPDNFFHPKKREKMARLIAAAPGLLDACKTRENALWDEIEALTKCTPGQCGQLTEGDQAKYTELYNEWTKINAAIAKAEKE